MNFNKKSLITGILLILIGLVILGNNLGIFHISWDSFWPWILLIGGILFFSGWLSDREKFGLLMPASILTVYGLLFLYCSFEGWWHMEELWPYFLIGPGLGFFLMYIFGQKETALLIPGGILLGLGILFLLGEGTARFFWPILLIIIGFWLLLRGRQKKKEDIFPTETTQFTSDQIVEDQENSKSENKDEEQEKGI
jgi:hypothetical protein